MEILRKKGLAWFLEDGYQSIVTWIHLLSSGNTPESVWFKKTDYPFQIAGIENHKEFEIKTPNPKIILFGIDAIVAAELMNKLIII